MPDEKFHIRYDDNMVVTFETTITLSRHDMNILKDLSTAQLGAIYLRKMHNIGLRDGIAIWKKAQEMDNG